MSETAKKYPRAVKAIYVAGAGGEEGREVNVDSSESDRTTHVSKMYRDWDREVRAMSMAASEFFRTYLENHDASNEEIKDGSVKHFAKNTIKAHKAAFKVLKKHSKALDSDPSKIQDDVIERLEDLEDELEED
jgi:hypothetical protein